MSNNEANGDIHDECAAEIRRLEREVSSTSAVLRMANDRWEGACDIFQKAQGQLDACHPYLKEGETAAECLARNRMDIDRLMGFLATEKTARDNFQADSARYRWLRMNRLWLLANLAAMTHAGDFDAAIDKAQDAPTTTENEE